MIEAAGERFYQLFSNFGPKIPGVIIAIVIGYLAIQILMFFLKRVLRVIKFNRSLCDFIVSLISIVMWVLLLSEIARQLGLSSLALTISGSIVAAGFALASGASSLTSDIIAGLFFAKDRDFEVGFRVKVGEIEGTIEKIDIRKIRIRNEKGHLFVLPSSKVDTTGWEVIETDKK